MAGIFLNSYPFYKNNMIVHLAFKLPYMPKHSKQGGTVTQPIKVKVLKQVLEQSFPILYFPYHLTHLTFEEYS